MACIACMAGARALVVAAMLHLHVMAAFSEDWSSSWADVEWESHGNGLLNRRQAEASSRMTAETVRQLQQRWAFPTGFDVSATPAVADGAVYFPGWNGMLYAVELQSGRLLWQLDLRPLGATGSRTTPVVWKEMLVVGIGGPPIVAAVNRFSGRLLWQSAPLDPTPYAKITMSGTAYRGFYYVGISSSEEVAPTCCTFQGSFVKLDLRDGRVVWRTHMVPVNSGYFGNAVWGSSPSINVRRNLVYIATGNNYAVPRSVEICQNQTSQNNSLSQDSCSDPANHLDSILALDINDGRVVWSKALEANDVWTLACQLSANTPNCPSVLGPDYDFGEAPMIIYLRDRIPWRQRACIVVAGQKSGVVWALDCDTGSIVWSTAAGPGGALGGASWGSCSDGERVYTNIINNDRLQFTLAPGNASTSGGGWVAMDARTGTTLWSTAEPSGGLAIGPVSVARGVVFGTSYTSSGDVYALDALTGSLLWHGTTGAGVYGGVSISRSCIFVGNGYNVPIVNSSNGTALTAFCIPNFFT